MLDPPAPPWAEMGPGEDVKRLDMSEGGANRGGLTCLAADSLEHGGWGMAGYHGRTPRHTTQYRKHFSSFLITSYLRKSTEKRKLYSKAQPVQTWLAKEDTTGIPVIKKNTTIEWSQKETRAR